MRKIRRWIGGLLVAASVYLFYRNVFLNVPTDVSAKFASMEADMGSMLERGGTVVFKNDLDRGSAAFVMRDISSESWSDDLFTNYRSTLNERGWKAIDSVGDVWQACRSGVLATIATKQGFFPAQGIYTYSMRFEYNAGTIRQCRNLR
jgi:hypothetical protein